jgi:shugoshin-like 2
MQLQKEAEKLNFENTFLGLKLNTLNKKLTEGLARWLSG